VCTSEEGFLLLQVQAGVMALERRAADAASNTARGGWGSTALQHEPAVSEQDLAAMQQDVAKMHDKYGTLLKEFLTGLPAAANEVRVVTRRIGFQFVLCKGDACVFDLQLGYQPQLMGCGFSGIASCSFCCGAGHSRG
jgi:hypothetical protein